MITYALLVCGYVSPSNRSKLKSQEIEPSDQYSDQIDIFAYVNHNWTKNLMEGKVRRVFIGIENYHPEAKFTV